MGFNVSVGGVKNRENYDCSKFIDRNYYNFTVSYEMYEDTSVLIKTGEYFGLDLKPLGLHLSLENDFSSKSDEVEYFESRKIRIGFILPILNRLKDALKNEPLYLEKVNFDSKENINQRDYFEKYTSSESIQIDLTNIIESIECYSSQGEVEIYFEVG